MSRDEAERQKALDAFDIVGTEPERDFDDIAEVAAQICGVETALISLIDHDRQWFKAKIGIAATQTPRSQAFCDVAMWESDVVVVPDATQDPRFRDNPLVTGEPHIRFYAGAPLRTRAGQPLGTLCVISSVPRGDLLPTQRSALLLLARQVVVQFELRAALQQQRADEARLRLLVDMREMEAQELSHRIKNIFSIVSGLISLSARMFPEAKRFADALRDRIIALGRAHDLIRTRGEGSSGASSATLQDLLTAIFKPYGDAERAAITIEGDEIAIDDRSATPLALIFHELVTKATQRGALSDGDGRVHLAIHSGETVMLDWKEWGGASRETSTPGFGDRLVSLAVEAQLGGKLEQTWEPDGLRVRMGIPALAFRR